MNQQTPAPVSKQTPPAPLRIPKPVDSTPKWVSNLLLQYGNTSFSVGSVIDKERSMYHDAPLSKNEEIYKSRLTFALESLIEESKHPSVSSPQVIKSVDNQSPFTSQVSLPSASNGTSIPPTFNGSAECWTSFKVSLQSYMLQI